MTQSDIFKAQSWPRALPTSTYASRPAYLATSTAVSSSLSKTRGLFTSTSPASHTQHACHACTMFPCVRVCVCVLICILQVNPRYNHSEALTVVYGVVRCVLCAAQRRHTTSCKIRCRGQCRCIRSTSTCTGSASAPTASLTPPPFMTRRSKATLQVLARERARETETERERERQRQRQRERTRACIPPHQQRVCGLLRLRGRATRHQLRAGNRARWHFRLLLTV